MGQKVNPIGLRIGIIKTWRSRWFANKKDFPKFLYEDQKIKAHIKERLSQAAVSRVEIERAGEKIRVIIFSARPGVIIGRRGADIDKLKEELASRSKKEILIDIKEIKNPAIEAQLVADNIAYQLVKRIAFRRAMKRAIQQAKNAGCLGIKMYCKGRLGGSEIARKEAYKEGKVPLHTLRADIDYGFSEAHTTFGLIGIKCWIYKGEVLPQKKKEFSSDGVDAKESKIQEVATGS